MSVVLKSFVYRLFSVKAYLASVCLLAGVLLAPNMSLAAADAMPPKIAVFPLLHVEDNAASDWLSVGLHESLTTDIAYISALNPKTFHSVNVLVAQDCPGLKLSCVAKIKLNRWQEIARKGRLDGFIWGDYKKGSSGYDIALRIYAGTDFKLQQEIRFSKPLSKLLAVSSKQLLKLLKRHGFSAKAAERKRVLSIKTRSIAAWEYYAKGYWLGHQGTMGIALPTGPISDEEIAVLKVDEFGYTGEKLSVNFPSIKLSEFLNHMAEFTGLFIQLSEELPAEIRSSSIAVNMKNKPWDQVLDLVFQSKGLSVHGAGSGAGILVVAEKDKFALEKNILEARQQYSELGPRYSNYRQWGARKKFAKQQIAMFEQAVKNDPNYVEAKTSLDIVKLAYSDKAKASYVKILALKPWLINANVYYAFNSGQSKYLSKAIQLNPSATYLQKTLANFYLVKKSYSQALQTIQNYLAQNSNDYQAKQLLCEILHQAGKSSKLLDCAMEVLANGGPYRPDAARTLGKIGLEKPAALLNKALSDSDAALRRAAAKALGEIALPTSVEALITAAKDSDPLVRADAIYALRNLKSKRSVSALITSLEDEYSFVRFSALRALVENDSPKIVPALLRIAISEKDEIVRAQAEGMLDHRVSDTQLSKHIPKYIELLDSPKGKGRLLAIKLLGSVVSEEYHAKIIPAVPRLKELLNDSSEDVRGRAEFILEKMITALGKSGTPRAIKVLKGFLDGNSASLRDNAMDALASTGNKKAISVIAKLLDSKDASVRNKAIEILAKTGKKAALPHLVKLLNAKDGSVREKAVDALGKLGRKEAVPHLVKVIKTGELNEAMAASKALITLNAVDALPIIDLLRLASREPYSFGVSGLLRDIAKQNSSKVNSGFRTALGDRSENVRELAASVLGDITDKSDIELLIKLLNEKTPGVRNAALEALVKIGESRAVQPILSGVADGYWEAEQYYRADGQWGNDRVIDALQKLASKKDINIFEKALEDDNKRLQLVAATLLLGLSKEDQDGSLSGPTHPWSIKVGSVSSSTKSSKVVTKTAHAASRAPRIGVFPFRNATPEVTPSWLTFGLQNNLNDDLGYLSAFNRVDFFGSQLNLKDKCPGMKMTCASKQNLGKWKNEARKASYDGFFWGEYTSQEKGKVQIKLTYYAGKDLLPKGEIVFDSPLSTLSNEMSIKLLALLKENSIPITAKEASRVTSRKTEVLEAWEMYSRGLWAGFTLAAGTAEGTDAKAAEKKATEYIERAVALDPNYAEAHVFIEPTKEESKKSVHGVDRALQLKPFLLSAIYFKTIGSNDSQLLRKAVEINPSLTEFQNNLIANYLIEKKFGKAIVQAHKYLDMYSYDGSAWIYLGQAYQKLNSTEDAEHAFNEALKDKKSRGKAAQKLADLGHNRVIPILTQELSNADKGSFSHWARASAADALGKIAWPDSLPQLVKSLKDPESWVRSSAATALGELGLTQAVPHLIKALDDPEEGVRASAVAALGKFGTAETKSAIIGRLADKSKSVLVQTVFALDESDAASAANELVMIVEDTSAEHLTRWQAASLLRQIEPDKTINFALNLIKNKDPKKRQDGLELLAAVNMKSVVEKIVAATKDPIASVRISAVKALAQVGTPNAYLTLIQLLNDKDVAVRKAVLKKLLWVEMPNAIPAIAKMTKDSDKEVRLLAVKVLGRSGSFDAITHLIRALKDPHLSEVAVEWLEILHARKAIPEFLKIVTDQNQGEWTRYRAALALGGSGDVKIISVLIKAMESERQYLREAYTKSIANILVREGLPTVENFIGENMQKKWLADILPSLAERLSSDNAVPFLIDHLEAQFNKIDNKNAWLARSVTATSKSGRVWLIPFLARLAKHPSSEVRSMTTIPLLSMNGPEARSILESMLNDKDSAVKKDAEEVLASMGVFKDKAQIIGDLKSEFAYERADAVTSLGNSSTQEASRHLIAALLDKDSLVRKNAAEALGKIKSKQAVPSLIKALSDKDEGVRYQAVRALGEIGSAKAIPHLISVLGKPNAKSSIDGYKMKASVIEALGKLSAQMAAPKILEALWDDSDDVRAAAIKAYYELKLKKAIPYLAWALKKDKSATVRLRALEYLANIGTKDIIPHLIVGLRDSDRDVSKQATRLLSGKLFRHLTLSQIKNNQLYLLDGIENVSVYTDRLVALLHFVTNQRSSNRLLALSKIHKRDLQKEALILSRLNQDITWIEKEFSGEKPRDNTYIRFFVSYALKESGSYQEALIWSNKTLENALPEDYALRITTRWVRAESLWRLGKPKEGLNEIAIIEKQLLSKITGYHRWMADLPFGSYTATLKGILLTASGQTQQGTQILYKAEKILKDETGLTVDATKRVRKIILSYLALALSEEAKKKADAAIELAGDFKAKTRLETDAEEVALQTRVRAAIGEGDYETAHRLAEKLILRRYARVSIEKIRPASPAKRKALEQIKTFQSQIASLDAEIAQEKNKQSRNNPGSNGKQGKSARLKAENVLAEGKSRQTNPSALARQLEKETHDTGSKTKNTKTEEEIKKQREAARSDNRQKLAQQRREKQRDLKKFMVKLKKTQPEVAIFIGAQPTSTGRLQENLSIGQAIVQYLILPDTSFIFLITADDIHIVEVAIGREQLRLQVQDFREAIHAEVLGGGVAGLPARKVKREQTGDNLAKVLLKPIWGKLASFKHLIIIPNGEMHFLPFGALKMDGQFLIERYELSVLSNSSMSTLIKSKQIGGKKLFALANPTHQGWDSLEGAEAEVRSISKYFSETKIYFKKQATKDLLVNKNLQGWSLHLAMHAEASDFENTRLVLSDGFLTVSEIWSLNVKGSPLVVLSACETGIGERLSGDEVTSLADGFHFSGVQSVVSSLWQVSDLATKKLMEKFYRSMSEGKSNVKSLTMSKRAFIKDKEFQAPFFWSAFVMSGQ